MRIKITADSTCDLSPELVAQNDIEIFPLFVNKGGESFLDGVTIQPADIFAHVANGGDLCTTAAVPVGIYQERFEALARDGEPLEPGTLIAKITGSARSVLTGERLALNLLQHLMIPQ